MPLITPLLTGPLGGSFFTDAGGGVVSRSLSAAIVVFCSRPPGPDGPLDEARPVPLRFTGPLSTVPRSNLESIGRAAAVLGRTEMEVSARGVSARFWIFSRRIVLSEFEGL